MIHGASAERRPCYGRPMLTSRLPLLGAVLAWMLLLGSGCVPDIVGTTGFALNDMFPAQQDWFWRYNNDGWVEEIWWQGLGTSSPDGEDWTTLRVWMDDNPTIIADFIADESNWSLDLFFADRLSGWHLMGYAANPQGPHAELGSDYLEGDGVPFLMKSVLPGDSWSVDLGGETWTTTATRSTEQLTFNSQLIADSWRVDVASGAAEWPFEGTYWFAQGPGIVQYDVSLWRPEAGQSWQHLHNDSWLNRLGTSDQ